MASRNGMQALARLGIGVLSVIVLGSSLVFGQGFNAAISGSVRDSSGAVIPQASVSVRNIETGQTRLTETGINGNFNVPALPVGPYEVTVEKPGFRQLVRGGINLAVAQEAVLNLTLEVGQVTQTVEVTGEAPLVNTTLSDVSGLVTDEQIKDLPLNGRSFSELLLINANTSDNRSNTGGGGPSFSVAGKRLETNRWTINGVDYYGNNQQGTEAAPQGLSGSLLGVDAVREYNVLGHTYGAEYGKRAGGQVTIVTQSGTNQLHGTAFEYLRNNVLDARNFYNTGSEAPPFKRNQFGGSLGGPIIRDKMFVFGNYEGFRERLDDDTTTIVPSAQARLGQYVNSAGVYETAPRLVPRMLDFFRYWPEANGPEQIQNGRPTGAALSYNHPRRPVNEDFGMARFDYSVTSRDSLSTNLTIDRGFRKDPEDNPIMTAHQNQSLYTLGIQETHIFTPTILNLFNFGYSLAGADAFSIPDEPFPDNILLMKGVLNGDNRSNPGAIVVGGGSGTAGASIFESPNGRNLIDSTRQNFSLSNDLRMTRGMHNLGLGVWYMRIQQNLYSSNQNNAGTITYGGLREFLEDRPTQFTAAPNPTPLHFRQTEAAWYVQDEIKLRPNLTVRLGLRYEATDGWNEVSEDVTIRGVNYRNGIAANYDFDAAGNLLTNTFIGRSALTENNAKALLQPRIGVAWDPTGAGKWSVRAGFGIHNDLLDNLGNRMNSNQPFNGRVVIQGPTASDPVPLLSIIPFSSSTPPAPQCQTLAEAAIRPAICTSYAPAGVEPNLHTPTIQEWSLEIQRELSSDLAVEVSYIGSQAYHLSTSMDMNAIRPLRCEDPAGCRAGGRNASTNRATVPQGTEYVPVGARRNPLLGSSQMWVYLGTSSYHSGAVSVTKRTRGGLGLRANYTFSKVLDVNSAILGGQHQNESGTILNPHNLKLSKGVASYHVQNRFNGNFSYDLPLGRGKFIGGGATGWLDKLIGGWQWHGVASAQSGFPILPLVGSNQSGNGDQRNPDVPNLNPAFQGNPVLGVDGFKKTGRYFDPNAFLVPLPGTFGNVARGTFFGPGQFNINTSFFKQIPIKEGMNLQFRTEIFNLFNHANFDTPELNVFEGADASCREAVAVHPSTCRISGSAGQILQTTNRERQIQFALRLEF